MAWSSKRKIGLFSALLLLFIGFLVAGLNNESFGPGSQPVVRQFPNLEVKLLADHTETQSQQLFTQDYQLVNVWASWCGVCKKEHAYLNQLEAQGIAIIGFNYRDRYSGAVNYLAQLGNPYRNVIYDPKGLLALELGVVGTPETYLVKQSGEIVYKHLGVLNERVWQKHFARFFTQEVNG